MVKFILGGYGYFISDPQGEVVRNTGEVKLNASRAYLIEALATPMLRFAAG